MINKRLLVVIIFSGFIFFETPNHLIAHASAVVSEEISVKRTEKKRLEKDRRLNSESISELIVQQYIGWWIYGEGQHIFKDESTLEEWELIFLNENTEELETLYLAVCEMEYFPMECVMKGNLHNDTLMVDDFEILYIQGCGE